MTNLFSFQEEESEKSDSCTTTRSVKLCVTHSAFQNHGCYLCSKPEGPPIALFMILRLLILLSRLVTDVDIKTRRSSLTRMKTEFTLFSLLYSTVNEVSINCCQTFSMSEQAGRKI